MGQRVGAFLIPGMDFRPTLKLAQEAEGWGYESLWVAHGGGRDAFLVLSAYAQVTRTTGLGTGVIPIYPRHPVVLAQEALTLAELSAGRFRLGIGVSHRPTMTDALGLELGNPVRVMREYVSVLLLPFYRAMLTASGFGEALAAFDRARSEAPSPAHAVPDQLVEALGAIGDGGTVQAYAAAYRQAGVTLPAIRPIGFPDSPHYRPTLQAFAV